jgi:hypothetical protein
MRERRAVESMPPPPVYDAVLDRDGAVCSKRPLASLTGTGKEVFIPFDLPDLFDHPARSCRKRNHHFVHPVSQRNIS